MSIQPKSLITIFLINQLLINNVLLINFHFQLHLHFYFTKYQ